MFFLGAGSIVVRAVLARVRWVHPVCGMQLGCATMFSNSTFVLLELENKD